MAENDPLNNQGTVTQEETEEELSVDEDIEDDQ